MLNFVFMCPATWSSVTANVRGGSGKVADLPESLDLVVYNTRRVLSIVMVDGIAREHLPSFLPLAYRGYLTLLSAKSAISPALNTTTSYTILYILDIYYRALWLGPGRALNLSGTVERHLVVYQDSCLFLSRVPN